jgi:hypothetical protein
MYPTRARMLRSSLANLELTNVDAECACDCVEGQVAQASMRVLLERAKKERLKGILRARGDFGACSCIYYSSMTDKDPRSDLANILKELNDTLDASRAARRLQPDRRNDDIDYSLPENNRRFWQRRTVVDRRAGH